MNVFLDFLFGCLRTPFFSSGSKNGGIRRMEFAASQDQPWISRGRNLLQLLRDAQIYLGRPAASCVNSVARFPSSRLLVPWRLATSRIVGGLGAAIGRGVRMVIPLLFLPFSSNLPEAPGTRHGGEIEHAGEKNEQATMPTFIRGGFCGCTVCPG